MELNVTSTEVYGTFKPGEYLRVDGTFWGELSPAEAIPDLDKAARNDRGLVEYSTSFMLIVPKDPRQGNGTLLVDLPNRGQPSSHYLYNSPRDNPLPVGSFDIGNGFLENHGFAIASVQWELGRGINLPTFTDDQGQTRYIEGVALAAIRDFLDYIRNSPDILPGLEAPLSEAIARVLGVGWSQTGRLLKTLLLLGFNRVEQRRVIDGIHHQAGPTGWLPIMQSGTGPSSSATSVPTPDNPDLRGIVEEPLTPADMLKVITERGETPPRMVFTVMSLDYYILRASLFRTGAQGTSDLPIPDAVRIYDVAGGSHAIIPSPGCTYERGKLDWRPVMRSLLLHLERWVKEDVAPPPNRLMPLEVPPQDSSVLQAPTHFPNAIAQVPQLDADGNPLGGIRLPDIEVPLGTHGSPNAPASDFSCFISGSFLTFVNTHEERKAKGDKRLCLKERYSSQEQYLEQVQCVVNQLVKEGFLLEEDI
jgi:hypothetical protein